jgi:predicted N-acyltransferase
MSKEAAATLEQLDSLADVEASQWDALAGSQPFVRHAFLRALETSGCVGGASGWLSMHLVLRRQGRLQAALPLYLKHDSYGEFVFDWSWARAFAARWGRSYYPKLVSAVPFTPVAGPRLLGEAAARQRLLEGALELARALGVSSWHCLFPTRQQAEELAQGGLLLRQGVQLHWHNAGYASFDDFLASLTRERRKKIRQERRRLFEAGVRFEWRIGSQISEADWHFFNRCYRHTYREHGSAPYLNLAFFLELGTHLGEACLLVLARRGDKPIAAALNLFDGEALYGRYWGSLEFVPGLHFETCYYQGIAFCIERGLARFEGGAGGEHKLPRGFVPSLTWSAHWFADGDFAAFIGRVLSAEAAQVAQVMGELQAHAPFRQGDGRNKP